MVLPPEQAVKFRVSGRLAIITFDDPKNLNALAHNSYSRLGSLLRKIAKMPEIAITVITGTGRFFSAGADVGGVDMMKDDHDRNKVRLQAFRDFSTITLEVTRAFYTHPKIVIAALNGPTVGLSAAVLGFVDFVYATPHTWFLTPFTSLGIAAEGGASLGLVQKMGYPTASQALIMSKRIPCQQLVDCGFVYKVLSGSDQDDSEGFFSKVLEDINQNLGDRIGTKGMLRTKQLMQTTSTQAIEALALKEIMVALDFFEDGDAQAEFLKNKTRDCHHRKVKCSGETPCPNCRTRDVLCIYDSRDSAKSKDSAQTKSSLRPRAVTRNDNVVDSNSTSYPKGNKRKACDTDRSAVSYWDDSASNKNKTRSTSKDPGSVKSTDFALVFPENHNTFGETPREVEAPMIVTHDENMDTYDLQSQVHNNISLSSQLVSLGGESIIDSTSTTSPLDSVSQMSPLLRLRLPSLDRLQNLADVYFTELNNFFPMLDQDEFLRRLAKTLRNNNYNETTGMVSFGKELGAFFGMLCNVLAIAESHATTNQIEMDRPGWTWFQQGLRMIKSSSCSNRDSLDPACYYILGCDYLLHGELMSYASSYVMQAWTAASLSGLNDQSTWPQSSHGLTLSKQKLWWCLYYLDTHVARRLGKPYLIHETDVAVSDMAPKYSLEKVRDAKEVRTVHEHLQTLNKSSTRDLEYGQCIINTSRIWREVWDALFSARNSRHAGLQDIMVFDARILYVERSAPPTLQWNEALIKHYMEVEGQEGLIRRRLFFQLQINLLRMIIRQNPLQRNAPSPQDRQICVSLACSTISSCEAFVATCTKAVRQSSNLLTQYLIESLYHLTCVIRDNETEADIPQITKSFKLAVKLIKTLAESYYVPRRALGALTVAYSAVLKNAPHSSMIAYLVNFMRTEYEMAVVGKAPVPSQAARRGDMTRSTPADLVADTVEFPSISGAASHELEDYLNPQDLSSILYVNGTDSGWTQDFGWPELDLGDI